MVKERQIHRFSTTEISPSAEEEKISTGAYNFYQDVHRKILPYDSSKERIKLEPENEAGVSFVFNLFRRPATPTTSHLSARSMCAAIEEFVRSTAANLAYHGIMHYEIISISSGSDTTSQDVLWLSRIPGEVRKTRSSYRQIISEQNQIKVGKKYIEIPTTNVWVVAIPERLGTPNNQKKLIRDLALLDSTMPEFMSRDLAAGYLHRNFNVKEYSHNRFAQRAKLMRSWGWMSNQWRDDETTEYYWVYRQLLFYASLAYLRQYILDQMNDLLKRLQTPYQITVEGLPTEADLLTCIDGLESGELSFNEALRIIYQ